MTDSATSTQSPALFQAQRLQEIASLAIEHGRVEVADLAKRFDVTTETIRRDLSELQKRRLVRRVHGGATPWETGGFEPLLSVRDDQHDDEKRRVAAAALHELPDTGAVIIDSGSTAGRFVEFIPVETKLRFVTNSLLIARSLSERTDADVIVIGGKVRKNTFAMVDSQAIEAVEPLRVDTVFMSADAATASSGLTTPYREEAAWKRAIIRSARRVVMLLDHSKFEHEHFVRFADWSDVDVLVTNTETDPAQIASIEAGGTTVVLA
ncbi:DeoR/GlpR family DNA-binding transcription regulator [Ilumatobacter coccineus]|jgi:DeoR family transcriptional regulator, fructose operon transcriptional repressor|uniref:Lactose phosphotransferase system repressor n=1 Tax=Ilumatobacter coccineus (strain NBRC 103263 / KCTC 29153 / YM16-304) TaxID=1313172 RepID=A0A6C7E0R8_ILUCY|nr:DeoR/GlpR family DNA-binding transcription regulator [Ilumatobacter coccineus]BAN00610.1 putative DeoR family transcriptional regulator [Ilumatobacter coccineus YM16-304]